MLSIPKPCFKRRFKGFRPEAAQIPPVRLVMIGDSLSTGFHVSSPAMMLLGTRTCKGNWVVDDRGTIGSLFEQLINKVPVILDHLAYVSADVRPPCRRSFRDWMQGTFHLSHQVDRVLKLKQFPEMVLLWIGHNNLDWAAATGNREADASVLRTLADNVVSCYELQLRRLLNAAAQQPHLVRVIVFALISFERFFCAREQAEAIKRREPSQYPYLEVDYRYFNSMRSEFRNGMIQLANNIDSRLKDLVAKSEEQTARHQNVHVVFSTALHDVHIDKAEMLSDVDAWHPSLLGHRMLAQGAYPTVYKNILKQRGLS
jgi:hypothetical protein